MKSVTPLVKRRDEDTLHKVLAEEAPVGTCIMQDGKIRYFNSNFPIAIGYTADQLLGKDSLDIVAPEDREMVRENTIRMLKGELLSPYQFRVIHKDGSIRWFMAAVKPIRHHGRRAVLGNYMEITDRKETEEALKESEEKYRELANSITDVFFAMDEHLRYTYWNKASEILTGIRAEDATGKSLRQIFPDTPGIRNAEKMYRDVLNTQQPRTFVANFNGNGRHYIFEISAYPTRGGISVLVKDITERKQAEEALRHSEERYRTILEEMGDGYFETDLAGNLTFVNDAMIRLLGYSREEIIGMNFKIFTPKEKVKAVFEAYNRVYRTGEPLVNFPTEVIRKDGAHIFAETSAFPIMNNKCEIIGFRGIHRDITARKQMEEALRQSEERHRTILEEMEDSYFEVDLGGHLTFVNNSVCRDLGYSKEELIGMSYKDFTAENDIESLFRVFNDVYQTGVPNKGFPWKTVRKDESHGFAETSISLLKNNKGEIIGFRGVGRDITERRQMEEALHESEKKLRLISENSSDIICLHGPDHKYVYVSPACRQILGYAPEELVGTDPWELVHPDDLEALQKEGQEKASQGMPVLLSYRLRKKSGGYVWSESVSQSLKDEAGTVLGFVTSSRDITERKKTEEVLRQSKEKYRALFDSAVIGTLVVDAETMKVVIGNQAAVKMFGFNSAEQGFGANLLDFVPPEEREKAIELLTKEVLEQDSRRAFDFQVMTKDGKKIWISATGARITHGGRLAALLSFVDVTERKRAEEALGQSEERYRTILKEMEDSYFEVDLGGHLIFVNDSVCRDLGYSREKLIGMSYKKFVAEDDIASLFRVFNEVYRTGVPDKGFPWKTIRKDGSQGFAETSISLLKDDKDEIVGFRGVGRDISERKQAEETLSKTQAQLSGAVQIAHLGPWEYDVVNDLFLFNDAFYKIFHTTAEEVGGYTMSPVKYARRFMHPEDAHLVAEEVRKALQTDDPSFSSQLDHRIIYADGGVGYVSVHFFIVKDETGRTVMTYGVNQDITERKKMERALELAAEEWSRTFDSISDAVSIHDRDFRILRANKAFADLFQKNRNEIIGTHCYELHQGEKPRTGCPHQRTLTTGKPAAAEFYESHLGKYLWESTSPIFNDQGEAVGTVHITRDITQQKRQNERLMMTERLASLGELAAGTAHELNNPLTSIIGFSQLLMEKEVADDIREDLKLINNEAQRAANVTRNLLTFARKQAPVKRLSQINNIIEDVLKLRAYEHKANGIEVERHLDPDLPEIMLDYFQMQQVFLNVIINAEYFMAKAHNKGTLTITTEKQNNTLVISLADDGPGIPPENLQRIFDPFFTTKEAGKGTGLGLSICHGIVTEHGGQIYAMSQPHKGATIVVDLPIDSN